MSAVMHVVIPVDEAVDIRDAQNGEIEVEGDLQRLGRVAGAVGDLDAVQQPAPDQFPMHLGQAGDAVRPLTRPGGVVPEDEGRLEVGCPEGFHGVVREQRVRVAEEDRVDMARRHVAGDLRAVDDEQVALLALDVPGRQLERPVPVGVRDVILVGLVLQVLRDRDQVEAVPARLVDPDVGPDQAVGEDRVRVQVH